MRAKLGVVATVVALSLGVAGCGQPPGSGGPGKDAASAEALQEVYAQLEGLEGAERLKKLEELAAEEGETMTWYTSMNLEDSKPITDAFTEKYGIEVEIYRASSSDVLQRLLQESAADHAGSDVVAANGPEMQILDGENVLAPLETPIREDIFEGAQMDNWLGIYLNVFVAAWNTDAVSEKDAPTSWEQVLTGYPDKLAMELGDWDWFGMLVRDHFVAERGMSEDEAVELFRKAAREAKVVDGHTTMAELMVAGEYDVVTSAYQHRIKALKSEGAPVTWEKAIEPIIIRPNGIGIHADTDTPATSLLFIEYALTEGQKLILDVSRTPANTTYGGVPEKYETLTMDFEEMVERREKWENLYEEIIRQSRSEVVEGD